jgi:hypothetical protein
LQFEVAKPWLCQINPRHRVRRIAARVHPERILALYFKLVALDSDLV